MGSELDGASAQKRTTQIGEISGVHGVKGWVKIYSETAPKEKIFEYSPWQVQTGQGETNYQVLEWKNSGKALIAKFAEIEDRDQAVALIGSVIEVDVGLFESLGSDDYYWFQLQGLRVFSLYQGARQDLGIVEKLMETGANDVLVVRSDDNCERLIPWTPGHHILKVDLDAGEIEVDWDPDF